MARYVTSLKCIVFSHLSQEVVFRGWGRLPHEVEEVRLRTPFGADLEAGDAIGDRVIVVAASAHGVGQKARCSFPLTAPILAILLSPSRVYFTLADWPEGTPLPRLRPRQVPVGALGAVWVMGGGDEGAEPLIPGFRLLGEHAVARMVKARRKAARVGAQEAGGPPGQGAQGAGGAEGAAAMAAVDEEELGDGAAAAPRTARRLHYPPPPPPSPPHAGAAAGAAAALLAAQVEAEQLRADNERLRGERAELRRELAECQLALGEAQRATERSAERLRSLLLAALLEGAMYGPRGARNPGWPVGTPGYREGAVAGPGGDSVIDTL